MVERAGAAPTQDAAERLRGFGPVGVLAIVAIIAGSLAGPLVSAVLVLAWAQLSQTPLRALGLAAPRSWTATVAGGVLLGIAFKLSMKALVMPLLGAPPINTPYHYLAQSGSSAGDARRGAGERGVWGGGVLSGLRV